MTTDVIAHQKKLVADALASGTPLHVGVTLSYVGGTSDKFWSGLWADDVILVNYGPNQVNGYGPYAERGQYQLHPPRGQERSAAKFWDLLRSKTGKGYAVVDAAVMISEHAVTGVQDDAVRMMGDWNTYRDARAMNPLRAATAPVLLGHSPVSPTVGGQILMNLISPQATSESLLEAAMSAATERFVTPIALSRPDAPDEARFMAALSGSGLNFGI